MPDGIALSGAPLPMTANPERRPDAVDPEMRRAAEEFEAIFLAQMMAPMFEGLQTDGLGGGGMGEEMFRPMLIERYAEALTQSGGVGIADSIVRELVRMQEAAALTETPDGPTR